MTENKKRVAVIGAGAAGMVAAAASAGRGHAVTLFERNEKTGKKLYLTGKGRCNVTNTADAGAFMLAVKRNPKFLYSAFNAFTNKDIIEILNRYGVETKVERGGRVFPASDKSSDCIRALTEHAKKAGANIMLNTRVRSIEKRGGEFVLSVYGTNTPLYIFDAVIIATGGVSYASTGSTGDGYELARSLGHSINEPKPSLVPLVTVEEYPKELQGLTLKNVSLSAYNGNGKRVFFEQGELLFTHFGITGPLVLTLSGVIADAPNGIKLSINLKPALSREQLDRRVLRDIEAHSRKQLKNALGDLLPARIISVIIEQAKIEPEKLTDQITREERSRLCDALTALPLTVCGTRPIDEAVITRGGVSVKEINASTMESKLVSGLFFAGEIIDTDAQTGGYNLQIAFSTGFLAGSAV